MYENQPEQAPIASKIEKTGAADLSQKEIALIARSSHEKQRILELKLSQEKREQLKKQIEAKVNLIGPIATPEEQLTQEEAKELLELSKKLDAQPATEQEPPKPEGVTDKMKSFWGDVVSFAYQVKDAPTWGDRFSIMFEKGFDLWEKVTEWARDSVGPIMAKLQKVGIVAEVPLWLRPMPKDVNIVRKAAKAEGMELDIAKNEKGDVSKDATDKAAKLMTAVRKNAAAGHVNEALRTVIRSAKKENTEETSVTFDELIVLAEKTPGTQPVQPKPPEAAPQTAKREFKNLPDGENLVGGGATIEANGKKYDVSLTKSEIRVGDRSFVARVAGTVPLEIQGAVKKGDAIEFTMGALGQKQSRLMDRATLEDLLKNLSEKNKYEFTKEKPEDPLVTVVPV